MEMGLLNNWLEDYRSAVVATFGDNLKRIRQDRKMKSTELARALRVPPSTVSQWELESGLPGTRTLFKVAKVLRCSVEDLLAGIDSDYDEMRGDLIRHAGDQKSNPHNEGGADVPASGGVAGSVVDRVERLETELAATRDVANRLARLLEQSGVSEKDRPVEKHQAGVRRGRRKTG